MAAKSNSASSPCFLVRYWNVGAFSPCAISGSAAPSACSMSSVGGWKVEARDSSLSVGPCLEHRHRHAGARQMRGGDEADRPRAGDEDAIVRSSDLAAIRALLDLAAMPALVMMSRYLTISSCVELLRLLERHRTSASAPAFSKPCFTAGSFSAAFSFLVEPLQDRLRRAGRREQREPAVDLVLRQAGFGGGRRVGQRRRAACRRRPRAGSRPWR